MAFVLRCPECKTRIPWSPKMPEMCPNLKCETRVLSDRPDSDVVMPAFLSAASKANDRLYRDMERGSERRAEIAAEHLGVPVSDMSDLKITNLRPTRHEGDVAAPPVNNEITRFMDANPQASGFSNPQAMQYSGQVQSGPHPNVGARMRTAVQGNHQESVRRHMPHTTGSVVSELPALETTMPGYRRRG